MSLTLRILCAVLAIVLLWGSTAHGRKHEWKCPCPHGLTESKPLVFKVSIIDFETQ